MLGRDKAGSGLSLEKQEGALSKGFGQDRVSPEPPVKRPQTVQGLMRSACVIQGDRDMPGKASDKKGSVNQKFFNSFFNMNRGRFLDHCLIGDHSSSGVGTLSRGTGTQRRRLEL